MRGSAVWRRKLAHWLPYHQDRFFLGIGAAMAGTYQLQFTEEKADKPKDPETVRAVANRELDAFSARGRAAIQAYQEQKLMRGLR